MARRRVSVKGAARKFVGARALSVCGVCEKVFYEDCEGRATQGFMLSPVALILAVTSGHKAPPKRRHGLLVPLPLPLPLLLLLLFAAAACTKPMHAAAALQARSASARVGAVPRGTPSDAASDGCAG